MAYNKLILSIFALVLIISMIGITSAVLIGHSQINDTLSGAGSEWVGMKFNSSVSTVINGIIKFQGELSTRCYLTNSSLYTIAQGTFSGTYCAITPTTLTPGASYYVLTNSTTSIQKVRKNVVVYPIVNSTITWTSGYDSTSDTTQAWTVSEINVSYPIPSITLNSPSNGSILSSTTITLDANFSSIGDENYTWTNATFYNWKSGVEFNKSIVTLSGNNTQVNTTIAGLISGNYEWNVHGCYKNNTYSNCIWADNNFSYTWRPFSITSQAFTQNVYETESQRINLTISTISNILSVSAKLNYSGTIYNGITSCSSGICNIYSIIDTPLISSETLNKTFYWNIVVSDGTTTYNFDTSDEIKQQNITRIHLEECNATWTINSVNFTAYREDNLTRISPYAISGTFENWLGSGTVKRNQSFNKPSTTNLSLCISPISRSQYSDAQIRYSFDNTNLTYMIRDYWFRNATLTNLSTDINLYLLESEDSTSFILKVQDQKLSAVADALIYIQRYYPEDGQYRTVQIAKTDSAGESIGFYETETADYKHIIIKDGEVLLETDKGKVVGKDVPFTLTFTVGDALGLPWQPWISDPNIQTSLAFNKTSKIVTFTYIDITGTTTSGRLTVVKENSANVTTTTICNISSSQASATITCNMTGLDGSYIAYGYIESDVNSLIRFIVSTTRDIMGKEGLFLGFFIVLVAGFAFIWNPSAGIIAINLAVIFTNVIGFFTLSPIFIFGMIAVSIIALLLLKS